MFKNLGLISFFAFSTLSLKAEERVKVDVHSKIEKNQVTVHFKVATRSKGLKINNEGPWSLKLGGKSSEAFEKTTYDLKDFDKDLATFTAVSKKITRKNEIQSFPYELTAFSCNADASQCFRDLVKGEFAINR